MTTLPVLACVGVAHQTIIADCWAKKIPLDSKGKSKVWDQDGLDMVG